MTKVLASTLAILLWQIPTAEACTPTPLYGRAMAITDVMKAMLDDTNISKGALITKIDYSSEFVVVYTRWGPYQTCYTYVAGFNGNCSAHGAILWSTGACPKD